MEQGPNRSTKEKIAIGTAALLTVVSPLASMSGSNQERIATDATSNTFELESKTPETFLVSTTTTTTIAEREVPVPDVVPATSTTSTTSSTTTTVPDTTTTLPPETIPPTIALPETIPLETAPAQPSLYEQFIDCSQSTFVLHAGMTVIGAAVYCSPAFGISTDALVAKIEQNNPQIEDFNFIGAGTELNWTDQQIARPPSYTPGSSSETSGASAETIEDRCERLGGVIVTITGPSHIRNHLLNLGLTGAQADSIMFRDRGSYLDKYGLTNPKQGQDACMAGSLEALKLQYPNTLG